MSFIGATGLDEVQEQFDTLNDKIDANAEYINDLVGMPDPTHTAIFGINILNPGLFGLVERAEVNIAALQSGEEGLGTDLSALTTQVEGIQGEITGIQGEITSIQGEITGIQGEISGIQFTEIPALSVVISAVAGVAGDALGKANKSLGIWDEDGNNTYNMKSGNVAIGILPKGTLLNNKLEVNGSINIPTGSSFKINNVPFSYSDIAGTPPVSSKWTNATDVATNIYYSTGNVGIGITTAINNKLEVGGNINIPTGSKYKINNVNLAFSDLGGTLSYNSLTDKLTAGTNISIVGNSINNTLTAGTNISIVSGAINNTYTYTLPTAGIGSGGTLGGVKVDNSTITITNGVISAAAATPQVNSDWTQTNTSLKSFIQNKPTAGNNISFANNTITNTITGSTSQNIIGLNANQLIIVDKPNSEKLDEAFVPLTNEPSITSPAFTESIRTFTHSGGTEAQTPYDITIGQNTICDILIVGGGGSGDREIGGGGGGGAVLYATNITIPAGSYTIKVGKGGENGNGGNSEAFGAICLGGGSTDYVAWSTANNGKAGGSGSGGSTGSITSTGGAVGTSTKGSLLNSGTLYNGNPGGNALPQAPTYNGGAGGGGGAGTAGLNSTQTLYTTRSSWIAGGRPSSGGDGVAINITGTTYYWGAGGGGAGHYDAHPGDGGLGGGGGGGGYFVSVGLPGLAGASGLNSGSNGLIIGTRKGGNGGAGTGSGGGGGGYYDGNQTYNGGNGGSGIIIIKFKTIVGAGIPEGNPITHKTFNFAYDNNLLRYDFTNQNTEATWKAYAATIPNFTYSLDSFLIPFDPDAVWNANSVVGWVQMTLPSTHNFLTITYGLGTWTSGADNIVRLLINGVQKSSATLNDRTKTYSQAYNVGDVVRIEETLSTMSANFIFQFTNTNTDQYTLSVPLSGTGVIINNTPLQYLSAGNYTISVGATQSSVVIAGIGQVGSDPYPLTNGSTIAFKYSMTQRTQTTTYYKKDGLIKYVPASGTNPTTGTWQMFDVDSQALTQFAGNLPFTRIDGNVPLTRIEGNVSGKIPISSTDGNLPASRIDNLALSLGMELTGVNGATQIKLTSGIVVVQGNLYSTGVNYFKYNVWHLDSDGFERFYFQQSNTTYLKGHGTTPFDFRNGANTNICTISGGGGLAVASYLQGAGAGGGFRLVRPDTWVRLKSTDETIHLDLVVQKLYVNGTLDAQGIINLNNFTYVRMQSIANTGNELVCVVGNDAQGEYYNKVLYIAYGTFTGFHRCYVEDELCNDENVDIFKNEYIGRVVISTGKIKTDASRKKEGEENQHEWYSLEGKEGITIEDALPIIQLSRVRKDKRVYGVLGDPKRGTNNNSRIIVNGCGEGAICVANTNGNIENGDYIQTSDLLGYGEKQDDDLHRNYTIAKAVMDCNFELDNPNYECKELASGVRVAMIACVYKAS